ncbi:hypothetical protein C8J56DRAFT_1086079 [Mycena floridula]|nr:hypothetical protein C8J56DRAFT_1086079 [Mycena floridula]
MASSQFPEAKNLPRRANFRLLDNTPELEKFLTTKFGQKYKDIVKKYGAAECVVKDDSEEIVDVIPPEDYLQESDEFALRRHLAGDYGSQQHAITPGALRLLAISEMTFYASQVIQLRNEPAYLRKRVDHAARARPELLPDNNGNSTVPEDLLKNPIFVAQECRFTIHNAMLSVSQWALIAAYLGEVSTLDAKHGRFGANKARSDLLSCIKAMVQQEIEAAEKRIKAAVMQDPFFGRFWVRQFNHGHFTGARITIPGGPRLAVALTQNDLKSALIRFSCQEIVNATGKWPIQAARQDLMKYYQNGSTGEMANINESLSESLSDWARLTDFEKMLNHPDEVGIPSEPRYLAFAVATKLVQDILIKSAIEKNIRNIDSLGKPSVVSKIWKEFDDVSKAKCGRVVDQLMGFSTVAPSWYPPASAQSSFVPQAPNPDPEPKTEAHPPPKPSSADREPANIKPYWQRGNIAEPSVKLPVFILAKRDFDIFEKIFSGGVEKGEISFEEFEYAMRSVGFVGMPSKGSIVVFYPSPGEHGQNMPFTCQR